jgi:hypothetical protein
MPKEGRGGGSVGPPHGFRMPNEDRADLQEGPGASVIRKPHAPSRVLRHWLSEFDTLTPSRRSLPSITSTIIAGTMLAL